VGTVAGSLRESGKRSTCRWKAPRIREAARVDARAVEAVLALRESSAMGSSGARQGASEAGSPALGAADNATPGKLCLRAELFSSFINEGGKQVVRPKLERRRQALIYPGLDCRKVVRRGVPDGTGLTLWAHCGGCLRGASRGRGNRAIIRVLVSSVGCRGRLEASSRCSRGEPRGEPRRRRVGWRGGSSRTRRAGSRRSKGCGAQARERTMIAYELGPIARLDINPTEGVLGAVYSGLKQAAELRILARRRSLACFIVR